MTPAHGLEDVIAGATAISRIGQTGLLYRGYALDDLVEHATAEEVAFLLIEGTRPTQAELDQFRAQLRHERAVPVDVIDVVADVMIRGGHPMDALLTGISVLGAHDPERNSRDPRVQRDRARQLWARTATLIGAIRPFVDDEMHIQPESESPSTTSTFGGASRPADHRQRARVAAAVTPQEAADSHATWLLQRATGGERPGANFARVMDVALVIYAENEFNASTFAARTIASTRSDMHSAICGAIAALKGPLHGGANEEVTRMLREIGTPEEADAWIDRALVEKRRIMGFGHRVYKEGDPRAPMLMKWGRRTIDDHPEQRSWFDLGERVMDLMYERKRLRPNIDFPCGLTYAALGIPVALYPALFVAARIPGWCAHIIEQHENNRLITPRAEYTGPPERPWPRLSPAAPQP